MTRPLSPAAQAVMAAATRNTQLQLDPVYRECIAAALRALADQVVADHLTWESPEQQRRHWPSAEQRAGEQGMACVVRRKILAIAAELEAQP